MLREGERFSCTTDLLQFGGTVWSTEVDGAVFSVVQWKAATMD